MESPPLMLPAKLEAEIVMSPRSVEPIPIRPPVSDGPPLTLPITVDAEIMRSADPVKPVPTNPPVA